MPASCVLFIYIQEEGCSNCGPVFLESCVLYKHKAQPHFHASPATLTLKAALAHHTKFCSFIPFKTLGIVCGKAADDETWVGDSGQV